MKKRLVCIALCVYLSCAALFGIFNAKKTNIGWVVSPQCDLPPVLVEQ